MRKLLIVLGFTVISALFSCDKMELQCYQCTYEARTNGIPTGVVKYKTYCGISEDELRGIETSYFHETMYVTCKLK